MTNNYVLLVGSYLSIKQIRTYEKTLNEPHRLNKQIEECSFCSSNNDCNHPFRILAKEEVKGRAFMLEKKTVLSIPTLFSNREEMKEIITRNTYKFNVIISIDLENQQAFLHKGLKTEEFRKEYLPIFLELYALAYDLPKFEISVVEDIIKLS